MPYTPQLATLVDQAPKGDGWLHEIKYDGYRIGCRITARGITLTSRTNKDWTAAFPEIVEAARALPVDAALLDGEIAIILPDGRTSFQALQNAFSGEGSRAGLVYFVFDLLRSGNQSLERMPLETRKARLQQLLAKTPPRGRRLRYSEHVVGGGEAFFASACRLGLEGIVSKRRDAPYRSGRRGDWLKTKCVRRQEFVIGGFTDPEGARAGIGALLIGYYAHDRLVFSGKVGTGFTQKAAADLRRTLGTLEIGTCPFDPPPAGWLGRHAHWVKPALVCEVVFTEWTDEGRIRHPSFQGLRRDKNARDVVREVERSRPMAPPDDSVAGVSITHPDRVLYPSITKRDLARYYESIAGWIVPHVAGRPLTLVRCPEGIRGECFFMKHSKVWAPAPLRRVRIQEKTKLGEYLIADDLSGVVALVQMGVLEIHTWNSTYEHVELPNRIVIDLDPGEDVTWRQVIDGARLVRSARGRGRGGRGLRPHLADDRTRQRGNGDAETEGPLQRRDDSASRRSGSPRGRRRRSAGGHE
jgi:bifunctional non-homologous end joining protein LigD